MNKIDTTKQPSIPNGWTIESHDTSLGKINLKDIELYLDDSQKDGYIEGYKLREKLKDQPVLNATVLDYLWEHQDQIPESWKERDKDGNIKFIYFWGTIFRDSVGGLYVRGVYFLGGAWGRSYRWLGNEWDGRNPAAVSQVKSLRPKKLSPTFDSRPLEARIKSLETKMDRIDKILKL